jgi:CRP-like cAMP-binding protein
MHAGKAMCAHLLVTPMALVDLNFDDALLVADYMQPTKIPTNTVLFNAEQSNDSEYMLLIIDGEIRVESENQGDSQMLIGIATAGHLIGEMSLIDGSPRSATCVTATEVVAAVMSQKDFQRIAKENTGLSLRFLSAITARIANRLREANKKIFALDQINKAQKQQMEALMAVRVTTRLRS